MKFDEKQTNFEEISKQKPDYAKEQIRKRIDEETELRDKEDNIEIEIEEESDPEEITLEESGNSDDLNDLEEYLPRTDTTSSGRTVNMPKHFNEYEIYTAYCLISLDNDPVPI